MAVGMLLDTPEGSQELYEALTEKMFGTLQPATAPEGLIIHTAGPLLDGGWRVFDVWESEGHSGASSTRISCPQHRSWGNSRRRRGPSSSPFTT
jgi:hypothetical protein